MSELKPLIQEVLHMDRKQRRLSILVVEGEAEKLDSSGNRRSYLHYGGGGGERHGSDGRYRFLVRGYCTGATVTDDGLKYGYINTSDCVSIILIQGRWGNWRTK